MYNWITK